MEHLTTYDPSTGSVIFRKYLVRMKYFKILRSQIKKTQEHFLFTFIEGNKIKFSYLNQ